MKSDESRRFSLARAGRFASNLVQDFFIIVGVMAILFAGANYVVYRFFLPRAEPVSDMFAYAHWPGSTLSIQIYKEVFGVTSDKEAMARFKNAPNFAMHPTLPFVTQAVHNDYYRIGLEGIRYEPDWDDRHVASLLGGGTPLVFAMGGSTTLGHGLAGNETISFYLNKLLAESGQVVLNFGSQAYDQRTEIEKLIYLLKIGYRPRAVIFLDGFNDLFLSRSNMRLADKVVYHGFVLNKGEVAFTPGAHFNSSSYWDIFLSSLPVYRLIREFRSSREPPGDVKFGRNAFVDGFHFREAENSFRHWAELGDRHRDALKREILDYYQGNLKLLRALANEYGFRPLVFYQPNGVLDPENPFMTPAARSSPGYGYISAIAETVRQSIAGRSIDMIDLSHALNGVGGHRYIDVAHYTPAANEELAQQISQYLLR